MRFARSLALSSRPAEPRLDKACLRLCVWIVLTLADVSRSEIFLSCSQKVVVESRPLPLVDAVSQACPSLLALFQLTTVR